MSGPTHTIPRKAETKPVRDHRQNDRFTRFGERLALRIVAEHFVHFRTATNAEGSVRVPETHRFRDIPFEERFSVFRANQERSPGHPSSIRGSARLPVETTTRTSSATHSTSIFCMILARCASTVLRLISRRCAI